MYGLDSVDVTVSFCRRGLVQRLYSILSYLYIYLQLGFIISSLLNEEKSKSPIYFFNSFNIVPPHMSTNKSPMCRSMESSSSVHSVKKEEHEMCFCGRRARVCVSWTLKNPGRRFYTCAVAKVNFCIYLTIYKCNC